MLATGPQGEAIQKLAVMVAASSAFQERVRTYGQGELDAAKFVYSPHLDDPDQTKRPFALIMQGELGYHTVAGGSRNHMRPRGSLRLRLADNAQQEDDINSEVDFRNFVDGVLADLAEVSAVDDRLCIVAMTQTQEPSRTHPAHEATVGNAARGFWWCEYDVEWDAL